MDDKNVKNSKDIRETDVKEYTGKGKNSKDGKSDKDAKSCR